MRNFAALCALALLTLFPVFSEGKKKKKSDIPDPVAAVRPHGELTTVSFVARYKKKNDGIHTAVNLSCKPGFKPIWQAEETDEGAGTLDYFYCIPATAVFDYVRECPEPRSTECVYREVFTNEKGQPLSLATYEIALFRRSAAALPLCRTFEDAHPEFPVSDLPERLLSPENATDCFVRRVDDRYERTILFKGTLERLGG